MTNDHQRTIERLLHEPPPDWHGQSFEELAGQLSAANHALRQKYGPDLFDPLLRAQMAGRQLNHISAASGVTFEELGASLRAVNDFAEQWVKQMQPLAEGIALAVGQAAANLERQIRPLVGTLFGTLSEEEQRRVRLRGMNPLYLHDRTPLWMDELWERIVDRWPERWLPRLSDSEE